MTRPKLTYFDFPGGRGEDCRIALFAAGIDFEDDRVSGKTWAEARATKPYGKLPVFEVPGKPAIAGSNAILSLIGRQHDLHPADPFEAARHEALMGAVEDVRELIGTTSKLEGDEKKKAREELAEGTLQEWFAALAKEVRGPFVGGDTLNVADLKLYMILKFFRSGGLDHVPTTVFDGHPKLVALFDAVNTHPAVTGWYAR